MDKDKIFLVNLVEIDERLDPTYYLPSLRGINYIYETKKLNNISKCIIHPPEHKRIYVDRGIQLLRSQNIRPDGIDISNSPVFLDSSILSSTEIFPRIGDVLVVRSGVNAGDTATIDVELPNIVIGADTLLIRLENSVEPKYIQCFFSLVIGQKIMQRSLTGATNKHISPYNLSKINIPVPNLNIQKIIISQMDDAYAAKKQKELEAQRLLDSIDDYLLGELGIELPEPEENTIKNRIFIRNLSEVSGDRFDAPAHQKELLLPSTSFPMEKLKNCVFINPLTLFKGTKKDMQVTFIPMENVSAIYGEADTSQVGNIEESNGYTRFLENDLIWAKITPCMQNGKSAVVSNLVNGIGFGSTEFHVFRAKTDIDIKYIYALLRLKILRNYAILYFSGSVGHQRVSDEFFKKLLIPLPPLEKQIEISEHITAIRNQAKQLQQQAKEDLEKAKQEVEAMILGDD